MILSLFIKGMAWIILEKSDEVKKPKVMLRIEKTYRREMGEKKTPAKAGGLRGKLAGKWTCARGAWRWMPRGARNERRGRGGRYR